MSAGSRVRTTTATTSANMASARKDRRALIGNDNQRNSNFLASQSDDVVERQNDEHVEQLGAKISALRSLTIDIGYEVREQNKLLDTMDSDFSRAGGLLNSTMQRLTAFSKTSHGMQMCYLIAFVVFVFFVAYFAMGRQSSSVSSEPSVAA